MNRFFLTLGILSVLVIFSACQAVFTYSPFTFLQRDLASLPPEQQVTRAQEALRSGDADQMADAYEIVAAMLDSSEDPELDLLAADLAFGASGIMEVFTTVLQDPESISGATSDDLEEILASLNLDLISDGAGHVQDAVDAEGEVTEAQYILAASALIAGAAEKAGGFEEMATLTSGDPGYDDLQDAEAFLQAAEATDLLEMFSI